MSRPCGDSVRLIGPRGAGGPPMDYRAGFSPFVPLRRLRRAPSARHPRGCAEPRGAAARVDWSPVAVAASSASEIRGRDAAYGTLRPVTRVLSWAPIRSYLYTFAGPKNRRRFLSVSMPAAVRPPIPATRPAISVRQIRHGPLHPDTVPRGHLPARNLRALRASRSRFLMTPRPPPDVNLGYANPLIPQLAPPRMAADGRPGRRLACPRPPLAFRPAPTLRSRR